MKTIVASFLGLALTVTSSVAVSDVEYQDTDLHRSDDLVRFDRAYRAGLQDGTTTIIYSDSRAPGSVPQHASASRSNPSAGASDPVSSERRRYEDDPGISTRRADVSEIERYERSVPEKLQDDRYAETRRYPREEEFRSDYDYDNDLTGDCDCDEVGKRRAPKSEPVDRAVAQEPTGEATMREKLEAVRKARDLLRQSRGGSDGSAGVYAEAGEVDEVEAYGSATPRLIEHGKEVSAEEAPLTPYELDPDFVRNQEVSVEFSAATIEEIAYQIMPRGWRVRLSSPDQEIHEAQFEFISSDPREVALRKLLYDTGLGYKMFFNLKDDHGKPSPLLVISEVNS